MTAIDETMGLPELPDGQRWYVCYGYRGDYMVELQCWAKEQRTLHPRRWSWREMRIVTPETIRPAHWQGGFYRQKVVDVNGNPARHLTNENIIAAARLVQSDIENRDRTFSLLGAYPPKTLEEA